MTEDPRFAQFDNGNGEQHYDDTEISVEEIAEKAAERAAESAASRVAEQTARRPGRKPARQQSNGGNGQSTHTSRLFPSVGDEIVIKRRVGEYPNYKAIFVGQYNYNDVAASKTVEAFLQRYVVPKKGGGDYVVQQLSPSGVVKSEGIFTVEAEEPPAKKPDVTSGNSDEKLLLEVLEMVKNKKAVQDEKSQVVELLKQLGVNNNQNQPQAQQQNDMVRLVLDKLDRLEREKEDSLEKTILTKLMTKMEKDQAPPPMPMPLPPPQPDIGQAIGGALEKVLDRFAQMQQQSQQNQMSVKDVLEMVERMRPPPPPPPVKERSVFEQMMEFAQVKQTLFGDKDGQVERLKEQNDALKEQLTEIKQALREPSDPLDQIKQVVELNDALEQLGRRRNGGAGMGSMMKDIFGGVTDMARETGKVLDKQKEMAKIALHARKTVAAQAQKAQPEKATWPYPPAFRPYFNDVKNANDDLNRIVSTVKAFAFLAEKSPQWRKHYEQALALTKDDRKDEAIKYVRAFLNNLAKTGELSAPQVESILTAFERNWDALRKQLFSEEMPEDDNAEMEEDEAVKEPDSGEDSDGEEEIVEGDE